MAGIFRRGDWVKNRDGDGHGIYLGNGKVFVSTSDGWSASVRWFNALPTRPVTEREWAAYVAAQMLGEV